MNTENTVAENGSRRDLNVALLLSSYNNADTIAQTLFQFRRVMPGYRIFVYDRNSTDGTAEQAAMAGAIVVPSIRKTRAGVIRQMLTEIEADIFLLVDTEEACDPSAAPRMIESIIDDRADMVIGTPTLLQKGVKNSLIDRFDRLLLGSECTDIESRYRAVTRRFAKSFITQSSHYEIETDMSVYAAVLGLTVSQVKCVETVKPETDSAFISAVKRFGMSRVLLKETRPFVLFVLLSSGFLCLSLFFMAPVVISAVMNDLLGPMPSWVLASTLLLASVIAFSAGIILEALARTRIEQTRIHYQSLITSRGERHQIDIDTTNERRSPDGSWTGTPLQRSR